MARRSAGGAAVSKRANTLADLRRNSTGEWTVIDDGAPRPPIVPAAAELAALGLTGAGVEAGLSVAPLEHDEQAALFAWADTAQGEHPELAMLFAIPNGGARHPAVAAQLKAEGVKAGVPDVFLACARGRWHGLFVELKRADRSNHATSAQRAWMEMLRRYGFSAVVVYGAQEAQQAIMAYLEQEE